MQLLQHQYFEHEYHIVGAGSGIALARLVVYTIQVGTERLPVDPGIQSNQRIAHLGEFGCTGLNIKKTGLQVGVHWQ